MEKWIEDKFKDHKSKLIDIGETKILDFRKPGTSDWSIRFVFDEETCTLTITGDLGYLVARNYNNMTFEDFDDFVRSPGYFESKVKAHSAPFCEYDENGAREKLLKDYKEEIDEYVLKERLFGPDGYTEEELKQEIESEREDFLDEVFEHFDDASGLDRAGYDALSDIIPDFFEIASELGRKPTQWIDIYLYAFKEAKKRLPKKEDGCITEFEDKIHELADMLPDYGEREDEYNPVLDDLIIRFKTVAYQNERLRYEQYILSQKLKSKR